MGTVISFVNTKGGVGKSFFAVSLAVWLADKNTDEASVSFVNADSQETSTRWLASLSPKADFTAHSLTSKSDRERAKELSRVIRDLRRRSEFLIVDTKGSAERTTEAAVVNSDLAFIPLQPSKADIWELQEAWSVISISKKLNSGKPDAKLILNQTVQNDFVARQVRKLCAKSDIPIAKTQIKRLKAYCDSAGNCTVPTRLTSSRDRTAKLAIEQLFQELLAGYLPAKKRRVGNG